MTAGVPFIHHLLSRPFPTDLLHRPVAAGREDDVVFRWLGTAGFEVRAAGQRLLLDPFLSRPGVWKTLLGRMAPDAEAVLRHVERADHVFAGHSHHDHALDIGAIARQTGARVYGSESALHIARSTGAEEGQLVHLAAGDVVQAGAFRAQVLRSVHGKVQFGRVPFPGRMGKPPPPWKLPQFRVGASFGLLFEVAGLRFMHYGSADFLESAVHGLQCDVLLLCVVGRQGSPGFVPRILKALRPKVVLPCHWDDFMAPFAAGPRELRRVNLEAFLREVQDAGTGTEVAILDFFGEYRVPLPAGRP